MIMNSKKRSDTAIFIMPRSSSSWEGSEALWITAAGWASAAKRKLGNAIVVTSDRVAEPEQVWNYPIKKDRSKRVTKRKYTYLPSFCRTFFNDLVVCKNLMDWKILKSDLLQDKKPVFIWEKHDLFFGPGKKLSQELNVPLISYVHAPVVWEASKWGVKRYWWGKWLERLEAKSLRKADLVAVVSEEVKEKVMTMGVSEEKILISPMAVEPQLFAKNKQLSLKIKEANKLEGKFVIGWTGSFRKFHGLDHVIKAFKKVSDQHPHTVLMLVGDGSERENSERLVKKLGIQDKVIFTGRLQFLEIPQYISLFDVAVVSARSGEGFHYSPLKLREYMAAGKAVLAPNAGEIPSTFRNENNVKLFNAGNIDSLKNGMLFLIENSEKKNEIAKNGKQKILGSGTWEQELKKAMDFLKI